MHYRHSIKCRYYLLGGIFHRIDAKMATLSTLHETTEACNTLCWIAETTHAAHACIEMIIGFRGRSTESVKIQFIFPKDSILTRLHVFRFMGAYSGKRGVCQKIVYFIQRFYFNETPRFPLCAPIHLQCLSQFETLHYPWIPSFGS
jgi:hypothetical protein